MLRFRKYILQRLFVFFEFCLLILTGFTAEPAQSGPDQEMNEVCNGIMANIYYDILDAKGRYEELQGFGDDVLYENRRGIYAIVFEDRGSTGKSLYSPYSFGLSITDLQDNLFADRKGSFQYFLPVLGIKMVGYQPQFLQKHRFNVVPLIEKYHQQLLDYQQTRLPVRLYIEPAKSEYQAGEEIIFDVVLKNVSKKHMFVKTLGPQTLFFLLNNEYWGTRPASYTEGGERVILRAGNELRVRFKGEGFLIPKNVAIYGVYNISVQGVNPYSRAEIQILK